jgi:YHS domain-containing protein
MIMRLSLAGCCVWVALLGGCAASPSARPDAGQPHAECLVCKKNADLACIDVAVDDKTPSYAYEGKTYYFCSEECKREFATHPARYAGKSAKPVQVGVAN